MYFDYFFDVNHFYILLFIFVMITMGIIKEHNLFNGVYSWLLTKVKNKKTLLVLFSTLAGIIPIQGRIVISTALLDTIASKQSRNRKRFGILNYLASHHYYLWSPTEKSILIPMTLLGISYITIMSYFWPLLLAMLLYTFWFVVKIVKPEDICINHIQNNEKVNVIPILPLLVSIGCVILFQGAALLYTFFAMTLFYVFYTKTYNFKKLMKYIDWKMLWILFFVIGFGKFMIKTAGDMNNWFESVILTINHHHWLSLIAACVIGWVLSFLMGSSSKFAGVVAMLTMIFGLVYLPLFMAVEFSGYHMAFMSHKCIPTTTKYFGVTVPEYLAYITPMCLFLIGTSIICVLWRIV